MYILFWKSFGENFENITYSEKAQEQVSAARLMMAKLKARERIREEITWKLGVLEKSASTPSAR